MFFLWVILYGVIYVGAEFLSNLVNVEHVFTSFALLIYAVILFIYYNKKGEDNVNFKCRINLLDILYLLPLFIIPVLNLIMVEYQFSPFTILLMLSVCVIEEVFFRGIALNYFKVRFNFLGVILSALIFACFHAVNVAEYELKFVLVQIALAFAIGVLYAGVTLKFKTILFGIISHFITNVTGIGARIMVSTTCYYIVMLVTFIIVLTYGVWLTLKNIKQKF